MAFDFPVRAAIYQTVKGQSLAGFEENGFGLVADFATTFKRILGLTTGQYRHRLATGSIGQTVLK